MTVGLIITLADVLIFRGQIFACTEMKLQEYLLDVDKIDNGFQTASHHVHFEMLDFTVYVIQYKLMTPIFCHISY